MEGIAYIYKMHSSKHLGSTQALLYAASARQSSQRTFRQISQALGTYRTARQQLSKRLQSPPTSPAATTDRESNTTTSVSEISDLKLTGKFDSLRDQITQLESQLDSLRSRVAAANNHAETLNSQLQARLLVEEASSAVHCSCNII